MANVLKKMKYSIFDAKKQKAKAGPKTKQSFVLLAIIGGRPVCDKVKEIRNINNESVENCLPALPALSRTQFTWAFYVIKLRRESILWLQILRQQSDGKRPPTPIRPNATRAPKIQLWFEIWAELATDANTQRSIAGRTLEREINLKPK